MEYTTIAGHRPHTVAHRPRNLGDRRLDVGRHRRGALDRNDLRGARPRHHVDRYGARLRAGPIGGDRRQGARALTDSATASSSRPRWGSSGRSGDVVREREPRADLAGDRRVAAAPAHRLASTSIRSTGPTRWCRSTRRPEAMRGCTSEAPSGRSASATSHRSRWHAFRSVAPLHTAQPPYNLFEREAEHAVVAVLPAAGRRRADVRRAVPRVALRTHEARHPLRTGTTCRRTDPKFVAPRYAPVPARRRRAGAARARVVRQERPRARRALGARSARRAGRPVGRAQPEQLAPVDEVMGWSLDVDGLRAIHAILRQHAPNPVGPEFMALPPRARVHAPGADDAAARKHDRGEYRSWTRQRRAGVARSLGLAIGLALAMASASGVGTRWRPWRRVRWRRRFSRRRVRWRRRVRRWSHGRRLRGGGHPGGGSRRRSLRSVLRRLARGDAFAHDGVMPRTWSTIRIRRARLYRSSILRRYPALRAVLAGTVRTAIPPRRTTTHGTC